MPKPKLLTDDELQRLCTEYGLEALIVIATKNKESVLIRGTQVAGTFGQTLNLLLDKDVKLVVTAALERLNLRTPLITKDPTVE